MPFIHLGTGIRHILDNRKDRMIEINVIDILLFVLCAYYLAKIVQSFYVQLSSQLWSWH